MKQVDRLRETTVAMLLALCGAGACHNEAPVNSEIAPLTAAAVSTTGPSFVDITWMSISNIYYQLGPLNILTDGYITRIPHSEFSGGGGGLAHTADYLKPNVPAVLQVRDALGGASAVNLLLTGHSHFDHSFDTATWASSTGAPVFGSKTTCFQISAQNGSGTPCTIINGGDQIPLSVPGVTIRAVRWNHSGDSTTNPEQHNPVELEAAPIPDPVTGGLKAGVADSFPNGGGSRGFLFTVDGPQGRFSWFFQNSASTSDLTAPIVVDGVNYGAPLDNLKAAMSDAGLTSVDLWIGTGGQPVAQMVVPVLKPKAYLPVHWDDMFSPFLNGVASAFSDASLESFLTQSGVTLVRPHQYMDKWRLDVTGVVAIDNGPVKKALGFCKPVTACPAGKNCGTIADGCGGTVSCGSGCSAPQTCGGGGTANVCGCTPVTSCPSGKNCGTIGDGCGGAVSCGSACSAPQTCGGGGTANVCGASGPGISTDHPSYAAGATVTVTFAGLPGNAKDWIGLAPAGSPDTTFGSWVYTGGQTSGTATFSAPLPAGSYVSRAFLNDGFTLLAESASFTVTAPITTSTISTNHPSYAAGSTVTVTYAGLPGYAKDWIGLAPAGSPDTTVSSWVYTGGQTSGTATFSAPLPAGSYVARAFLNDGFTLLAESASFTVTAPITMSTISTDQSSYAAGATVTVTYAGLPGNAKDWIGLAPAGSPDTTFGSWVYTGGQTSGTATFSAPLPAGSYVARAFLNDGFTLLAESASFTVTP
jgi:L-ascorbate metabolism protein UlaG (beta-lactamase superfamily)